MCVSRGSRDLHCQARRILSDRRNRPIAKGPAVRLSQDELLFLAYFRSLDAKGRAPLIAAAHGSIYEPVYDRATARAPAKLIAFPAAATAVAVNALPQRRSAAVATLIRKFRRREVPDSGAAIFVTDAAGVVTHVNGALKTLLGIRAGTNLHLAMLERVHAGDRDAAKDAWHQAVDAGASYHRRIRYALPTGAVIVADVDACPFFSAKEKFQGYCGVVFEVATMKTGSLDA